MLIPSSRHLIHHLLDALGISICPQGMYTLGATNPDKLGGGNEGRWEDVLMCCVSRCILGLEAHSLSAHCDEAPKTGRATRVTSRKLVSFERNSPRDADFRS